MKRRSALVVALALASSFQAQAQTQEHVKLTKASVPGSSPVIWAPSGYSAFYVSPYTGVLLSSNNQTVVLNCVDFFHEVSLNEDWWANKSILSSGDLSATRFNNVTLYLQAAWLTQQYGADPGANANRTIAIQAAIWNIFNNAAPYNAPDATGTGIYGQDYWIAAAQNNYKTMDASKFYVLTPLDKQNAGSQQEFLVYDRNLVTTPEPATMTLLGTGLAFAGGFARRRRRKNGST